MEYWHNSAINQSLVTVLLRISLKAGTLLPYAGNRTTMTDPHAVESPSGQPWPKPWPKGLAPYCHNRSNPTADESYGGDQISWYLTTIRQSLASSCRGGAGTLLPYGPKPWPEKL